MPEISSEDFQRILFEIINEYAPSDLVTMVPDIYSDVCEHFNNEVIERFEEEQSDATD